MIVFSGNERFELSSQLGEGATGIVYKAFDRELDSWVAIKVLKEGDPNLLGRFKREFRSLRSLHHPNLIRLFELFEEDGSWFFSMEYIEGRDFLSHFRRG